MTQPKLLPPLAYLQACFFYSRTTGELIWRERPRDHFASDHIWRRCNTMYANKSAGTVGKLGYSVVLLKQTHYLTHRIAWKLATGEEPPGTIDHINGDPTDSRWKNLRAATRSQQRGNQKLHSNNTSGYRGVSPHQGKWVAVIAGRRLGRFDTPEDASRVYQVAAREHFGDFFNPP